MTDERPYTNREQNEFRRDLLDTLGRIETQVVKTNGRVSKLETWQSYVIGFCACITVVLLPIAFRFLTTHL